jgi:hypothetical protein
MLRSSKEMEGFSIKAIDGEIGKLHEFYFDDHTWTIRYIIVDTGSWLAEKLVLIAPDAFKAVNLEKRIVELNLDKQQIADSPEIDKDKTVSRQKEAELIGHYGWPMYWTGIGGPTIGAFPPANTAITKTEKEIQEMRRNEDQNDPNLRSTRAVISYWIHASDGHIGHVEDFLLDDDTWNIRYLIIDTKNLLPGKKVIIALDWIEKIDWAESSVHLKLKKEEIRSSPEYDPSQPVSRKYETEIHEHYGKEKYWEK